MNWGVMATKKKTRKKNFEREKSTTICVCVCEEREQKKRKTTSACMFEEMMEKQKPCAQYTYRDFENIVILLIVNNTYIWFYTCIFGEKFFASFLFANLNYRF